jgi:hypothetical protein
MDNTWRMCSRAHPPRIFSMFSKPWFAENASELFKEALPYVYVWTYENRNELKGTVQRDGSGLN